jgi:hypothetical protein
MSEFNFLCPACGQNISDDTTRSGADINCPACQAVIVVPFPTEPAGAAANVPPPETPPPWTGYNAALPVPQTSGLAIASLVCSLASLVTCVSWLPGIICGHLAKSRIRRNPSLKGSGLATTGLTIGYLIFMVEAATVTAYVWSFSTALKHGYENARQTLQTNIITQANPIAVTPPPPATASNNDQLMEPAASGWISDISQASLPDDPVGGKIHGLDFTFKAAIFRGANLRINSAHGLSVQILGLGKSIQSIQGSNYEIQATNSDDGNPRVMMSWNEDGVVQTVTYTADYGLKLQFGQAKNRRVSGKIYLCFPDEDKSCVAGTFVIRIPKPKQ